MYIYFLREEQMSHLNQAWYGIWVYKILTFSFFSYYNLGRGRSTRMDEPQHLSEAATRGFSLHNGFQPLYKSVCDILPVVLAAEIQRSIMYVMRVKESREFGVVWDENTGKYSAQIKCHIYEAPAPLFLTCQCIAKFIKMLY